MNTSSIGGIISALGKLLMAGGIFYPPLVAAGAVVSGVGSVISGLGADKTSDVIGVPPSQS